MAKDKTQREKFEEAARELETDESIDVFEGVVARVAKAPKLSDEEIKELARKRRHKG